LLAWLERYQWLVLALALLLFGAVTLVPELGGDGPAPLELRDQPLAPEGAPIRVHVDGAVVAPGVYELRQGDRLVDAIATAGGATPDADTTGLNLARRVRDEEQVLVPGRRTTAAPAVPLQPGQRLNLNTATAAQLDQLPGIGEAYSRRIVDSRALDGPFASPEDLVERRVVPRATFEGIRDLVSVGP
jgi:competence protein ComEA